MRGASTGCVPAYPIAVGDAAEAESMGSTIGYETRFVTG